LITTYVSAAHSGNWIKREREDINLANMSLDPKVRKKIDAREKGDLKPILLDNALPFFRILQFWDDAKRNACMQ
jgi:hypothetical protein